MAQTERSRRWRHRLGAVFLAITLLVAQGLPLIAQTTSPLPLPSVTPDAVGAAPVDPLNALAQMIFDGMTPEQRVGQLFVVTFQGDDVQFDSDIVDLITNYHVGGVVLSPRAGNFSNARGVDTPRQVAVLTNQLQAAAYGVLLPAKNALQPVPLAPWPPRGVFTYLPDVTDVTPTNLPLLIGVVQAGDDLPMTALRRGFTPLPSPMALGASWNRAQVTEVGSVVGRELQAVGFNVLLGPALDVFNPQGLDKVNGLGLATFGSNPYWVGQLGRAYIEGVHAGSEGRLATVVSSFPGQGSADRVPTEEVATLQSSQTELRLRDLAPFVVVTRQPSTIIDPAGDPGATDILMTSHMRYTGLQGADSRVRPLSLAPELRTILQQEGFGDWRTRGGVVMSGPLGAQALRRYLAADSPENFRRVAQDAFVAGNDLLFLADFGLDDDWATQSANIKATIQAFQSLYATDPDFAALVNAAARRIIRLKLGIYRGDIPTLAMRRRRRRNGRRADRSAA
jgi:beta-N-acetylhexosaminidase